MLRMSWEAKKNFRTILPLTKWGGGVITDLIHMQHVSELAIFGNNDLVTGELHNAIINTP